MRKIQNFEQLSSSETRKTALEIAEAGLWAIDTPTIVRKGIRIENSTLFIQNRAFSLKDVRNVYVVGTGKCALAACSALEEVLGDRIAGGIVLDIKEGALERLRLLVGDHPFPTERNAKATAEIITLLKVLEQDDLVLFVVSGGGSTLLCQPESLSCQDEAAIVSSLFRAGATIQELNIVRKHLSLARGGYLAMHAYPARSISLIFSDVPGDNMEFIASGPTIKDTTKKEDAEQILKKYSVLETCVIPKITLLETPKEGKYFKNVTNILFVSNGVALEAMAEKAKELGFHAKIRTSVLTGEARDVAKTIVEDLQKAAPRTVLLYGGETTVTIKHPGKGGRNLELGLSSLRFLQEGHVLLPLASDGRDNTDFAGAICDMITKKKALDENLSLEEYLENNRSYDFFERVQEYLLCGNTGSNVSDLIIAIRE